VHAASPGQIVTTLMGFQFEPQGIVGGPSAALPTALGRCIELE
jgi:hypothetical protein